MTPTSLPSQATVTPMLTSLQTGVSPTTETPPSLPFRTTVAASVQALSTSNSVDNSTKVLCVEASTTHLNESESSNSFRMSTLEACSPGNPATSSLQSSKLRFECGCGKCSVYDYINGEICPNQKQLPFPKLDIQSVIPSEEIEYIEEELYHQTRSIYRKFCSLLSDTFKELSKIVNHTELISHLKLVLKLEWNLQCALSVPKNLDMLENISLSDLPEHLIDRYYCSWFDYELLEHLRERYLFPSPLNEDEALNKYKECLKAYVNRRCFIYFHNTGPWPKDRISVKCKVDLLYDQLCQMLIKHLKFVLAKIIGAPTYHLAFMKAEEGCTELTFVAPPYFSEITRLSKYQVSQFKAHGFITVTISGKNLLQSECLGT